jgi:hypothetical protein
MHRHRGCRICWGFEIAPVADIGNQRRMCCAPSQLFPRLRATTKIIAPALNTLVGGHSKVFEASYTRIWEAIRALVKRAIKSGDIRKDLDPIDLLRALIGVSNVASSPDWQQSARRLVDILLTGSRPIK